MATYKRVDVEQLEADLTSVADSIRAKNYTTEKLDFPTGYISAISAIQSGGSGELDLAETGEFGCTAVETGRCSYNGVFLPDIPADALTTYSVGWIRLNTDGITYDLILSHYAWYYIGDKLMTTSSTYVWYTATADSDEWVYKTSYTDDGSFNTGNGIIWSSHDIPNGSATSQNIYVKGRKAGVGYNYGGFVNAGKSFEIAGGWLDSIANKIQTKTFSGNFLTLQDILTAIENARFDS